MSKSLKILGSVILTVFLALGWSWSQLLINSDYIDDKQQTLLLICLTGILTIQHLYLELPQPVSRNQVEERKVILDPYLNGFITKYYDILYSKKRKKDVPVPIIRVNIMLPTKKWKGLLGSYLKIYYYKCPSNLVIYPDQELSMKWHKKDGTCGWAWDKKDMSIYDSENPDLKLPEDRLIRQTIRSIKSIKSTLSVPIWYNKEVVGVFNIDSKHNVSDTMFHDERVYIFAYEFARTLGSLCFSDGVQA